MGSQEPGKVVLDQGKYSDLVLAIDSNILLQGENVSTKEPVTHGFYELHEEGEFDGNFDISLLQCDEDPPPTRKEDTVKRFAKLKCKTDMSYADLEEHPKARGGNF